MILSCDQLPCDLATLQTFPASSLLSPEETAFCFVLALHAFTQNEAKGTEMINFLKGPQKLDEMDLQFIRNNLADAPYLPLSYFRDSSPNNDYTVAPPYHLEAEKDRRRSGGEAGYERIFLTSSGADSKRPIELRAKGKQWFLWEYSSILLDIRKPVSSDPWADPNNPVQSSSNKVWNNVKGRGRDLAIGVTDDLKFGMWYRLRSSIISFIYGLIGR